MAQQTIGVGTTVNDGTGDTPRNGGIKINENFTELYAHSASTSNPHSVTKSQVGLSAVDNTADADKPISSATQTALDAKLSTQLFPLITESTTSRTLVLTDAQKYLRCTNASATSITVPPQASVAWVAGTEILVEQAGTGQVTIVAGDGVTIRTSQTLLSAAQYSQLTLKRVAENEWVCGGDREAA